MPANMKAVDPVILCLFFMKRKCTWPFVLKVSLFGQELHVLELWDQVFFARTIVRHDDYATCFILFARTIVRYDGYATCFSTYEKIDEFH